MSPFGTLQKTEINAFPFLHTVTDDHGKGDKRETFKKSLAKHGMEKNPKKPNPQNKTTPPPTKNKTKNKPTSYYYIVVFNHNFTQLNNNSMCPTLLFTGRDKLKKKSK